MAPNLELSWLIRVQILAKRGKLTSTWRLRGTKLELKGALEAPKEAPRKPKRATSYIDAAARGVRGGYIPCAAHVPPCCMGDDEKGRTMGFLQQFKRNTQVSHAFGRL